MRLYSLILALLLAAPAYSQIIVIAKKKAGGSPVVCSAARDNQTGGGADVVTVATSCSGTLTCYAGVSAYAVNATTSVTVVDSTSGTPYTAVGNNLGAQNGDVGLFRRAGITGSGTQTWTASGGSATGIAAFCVVGYTTLDQGLNQYAANGGTSTTVQPLSITPGADNQLVVGACAGADGDISFTAGLTSVASAPFSSGLSIAVTIGYVVQTTAAAIQPTCTSVSSLAGSLEAGIGSFQ